MHKDKIEVKHSYDLHLLTVLQVILLVLKLTGFITFSWWIVLLPTIIQATFIGLVILLLAIASIIAYNIKK